MNFRRALIQCAVLSMTRMGQARTVRKPGPLAAKKVLRISPPRQVEPSEKTKHRPSMPACPSVSVHSQGSFGAKHVLRAGACCWSVASSASLFCRASRLAQCHCPPVPDASDHCSTPGDGAETRVRSPVHHQVDARWTTPANHLWHSTAHDQAV